jgi:hypothetical protein
VERYQRPLLTRRKASSSATTSVLDRLYAVDRCG